MNEQSLSRRDILKTGSFAAFLAASGLMTAESASAKEVTRSVSLSRILKTDPVQMAKDSPLIQAAYKKVLEVAGTISSASLKKGIEDVIRSPLPKILDCDQAKVLDELKKAGYVEAERTELFPPVKKAGSPEQPFYSAPGSGYKSHHAYPGGLATHTAFNVITAQSLLKNYRAVTGSSRMLYDYAVGAELLHDIHKPWVFCWEEDGSCRKERPLAGTGEHHVLSIAESMKRGFPAAFVVAQACAHDHPGNAKSEASVVAWIKAAAIIAGADPVKSGCLASDGATLPQPRGPEGFVVHLADHDFVFTGPACQWTVPVLAEIARDRYKLSAERDLNAFRNYLFARYSAVYLYCLYKNGGKSALEAAVTKVILA